MILNKFRPYSLFQTCKSLSIQLLTICLFSCNKTANIYGNKAYIGLTHVAYGVAPLSMTLEQTALFTSIPFGTTTGVDGNPYDTAVSRVSFMQLYTGQNTDTATLLQGNAAFQQGGRYSIFAYDSLDQRSFNMIILQDNPPFHTDTFAAIRFMNFSPGSSIGIKAIYTRDYTIDTFHISVRDTVIIGPNPFVGYNPNPGIYNFSYLPHIGMNQIYAFIDSAQPTLDSSNFQRLDDLTFDSTKNYNLYLQGYFDSVSSVNGRLQIKSVRIN
jgi:hypothetical protein